MKNARAFNLEIAGYEWLCNNIEEAVAEVEACKDYVTACQNNIPVDRKELSMAKAALRNAESELRDWQTGIAVPPPVESEIAMGAAAGS